MTASPVGDVRALVPFRDRPPPMPGVPVPGAPSRGRAASVDTVARWNPEDEESVSAPPIPSFESLRAGGRRSPADVLLSAPSPAGTVAAPEWADLWRLGLRLARWCLRQPCTTMRRLVG